jgi:hypothetical protein
MLSHNPRHISNFHKQCVALVIFSHRLEKERLREREFKPFVVNVTINNQNVAKNVLSPIYETASTKRTSNKKVCTILSPLKSILLKMSFWNDE